jgi:hypothetical protein
MRISFKNVLWVLGVLILAATLLFLFTGPFDYFYLRSILETFDDGLNQINWVNPYLGKAVIAAGSAFITWLYYKHHSINHSIISLK